MKAVIKRISAWVLTLALVFSFLPLLGSEAYAAEEMNAQISEDGIMTWETVWLADTYKWNVDSLHSYSNVESPVDVYATLDELASINQYKPEGGTYTITLQAFHDDTLSASKTFTINYTPKLAAQMDVSIDGSTISWEPVTDAANYMVLIAGTGESQQETSADLEKIIDTLIKRGKLENDRSEWPVRVDARNEDDILIGSWEGSFEYASSASYVEPVALTVTAEGTMINVADPVSGTERYRLEYENYINEEFVDPEFDCYDYLQWLYQKGVIANGETIDLPVYALDSDEIVLGEGSVAVTFIASPQDEPIPAHATLSKSSFVYNGSVQKPAVKVTAVENGETVVLWEGEDYELHYQNASSKNAGSYYVEVWTKNPKYDAGVVLRYEITQAPQTISGPKSSYSKTGAAAAFSLGAKTNGGGKLTYKSSNTKVATVSTAGKVTIKGAGTAKITITAASTTNYKKASKTIEIKVTKAANPLTAKGNTVSVSASKVKKASQTITKAKAFTISKAQGTVTFAKSSGNSKITVNKTTGKITVKKGLKKGTYKVKIKVKAAGNTKYKALTKTVTVTVKVK